MALSPAHHHQVRGAADNAQLDDKTVKVEIASDKHHSYVEADKILGVKEEPDGRWIRVLLADPPSKPAQTNTQNTGCLTHC